MQMVRTKISYDTLVDTGVSLRVRLDTNPVSLVEAHALLTFLNEALHDQISAWEKIHGGPLGLIPVIELRSGSLEAIIRFLKEKSKIVEEFARDVTRDIAKEIAKCMIIAMLTLPGNTSVPAEIPDLPPEIVQCNNAIHEKMVDLVQVLQDSEKPYKLEVSCDQIVIQGNQPKPHSNHHSKSHSILDAMKKAAHSFKQDPDV